MSTISIVAAISDNNAIGKNLGVLCAIRKWFPALPVHASTQMTICGSGSVELLKEMGVERAVLSRELSLKEIADIYQTTGMELETFVHGALCYCYSGQCLFSSILGGRSGNRGRCAQPCRLAYQAVDEQKKALTGEQTLLSPKDICALDLIPKIAGSTPGSSVGTSKLKNGIFLVGAFRIAPSRIASIIPRVSLIEIRFPVPFHPVLTR